MNINMGINIKITMHMNAGTKSKHIFLEMHKNQINRNIHIDITGASITQIPIKLYILIQTLNTHKYADNFTYTWKRYMDMPR